MRITEHKKSKAGREYPCEKCPDGTSFEDEESEPSLDDEEKHEEWVENKEAWLQEQRDAADTALGEFEL